MALINVPAPAGSALAGQMQMRAMEGLGRALGQWYQSNLQSKDIRNLQVAQQAAEAMGLGQIPSWGMPQMRSRLMKDLQGQASIQDIFADPLERQYLLSRIQATEALTGQRKEAARQELPDRMLRQADRYLRVVDDIMSEYWYTPEGPYKDKLLKDAQNAREKAVRLIEEYGATSEAGKASLQQLSNLDEEIKRAGGKVRKAPTIDEQIKPIKMTAGKLVPKKKFIVDSYAAPRNKKEFDGTLSRIRSEEEKDRYFELHWKPEYGLHKEWRR